MAQQTGHGIHLSHSRGIENIPACSNSDEGIGEIGDRSNLSKSYTSEEIEPTVCCKIYESTIDSENYVQDKNEQIHNNGNTRMYNSLEMSSYSPIELSCSKNNPQNNNRNINISRTDLNIRTLQAENSNLETEQLNDGNIMQSQINRHLQNDPKIPLKKNTDRIKKNTCASIKIALLNIKGKGHNNI